MASIFPKVPGETLKLTIDWSTWLPSATSINASSWSADTGITVVSNTCTTTTSVIVVSGGDAYTKYALVNTVNTNGGVIAIRTIYVQGVASKTE